VPEPASGAQTRVERLTFSVAEVAEALGCTRQHITNLIARGEIPSLKLGRRRLIRRQALDAELARREADPS
jgi:excisionase family DNA binding protein